MEMVSAKVTHLDTVILENSHKVSKKVMEKWFTKMETSMKERSKPVNFMV